MALQLMKPVLMNTSNYKELIHYSLSTAFSNFINLDVQIEDSALSLMGAFDVHMNFQSFKKYKFSSFHYRIYEIFFSHLNDFGFIAGSIKVNCKYKFICRNSYSISFCICMNNQLNREFRAHLLNYGFDVYRDLRDHSLEYVRLFLCTSPFIILTKRVAASFIMSSFREFFCPEVKLLSYSNNGPASSNHYHVKVLIPFLGDQSTFFYLLYRVLLLRLFVYYRCEFRPEVEYHHSLFSNSYVVTLFLEVLN